MHRSQQLSGRHPFEIFLLALSIISGLPVLLGKAPAPGSINAVVDPLAARAWSVALTCGSALALLGVGWRVPKDPTKVSITGLSLEQVGLVTVASAATFYAVVVVIAAGVSAAVPASIILAYAGSCWVRAWQLQGIIKGTRKARHVD
jgi:hypothetical protein